MLNLERLEISPSKNGGHVITHHFKPRAMSQRGAMRGGLSMHYREPETHTFGAGQGDEMTQHIIKSLGLKNPSGGGDEED